MRQILSYWSSMLPHRRCIQITSEQALQMLGFERQLLAKQSTTSQLVLGTHAKQTALLGNQTI